MRYQKPFLPIAQQIAQLEARGLEIGDQQLATRALEQIGYYRLSAYWYAFREIQQGKRTDTFLAGAKLQDAVSLYIFDKKLRLLVLDAIERIEISLRTDIALTVGVNGGWAHRDAQYVHPRFNRAKRGGRVPFQDWMSRLDKCESRSRDEFVTHFRAKYTSERFLPIWMSVEVWELGLLSHFLSGMRHADITAISHRYGLPDAKLLPTWTRTFTFVRNVCAHHGRLWNRPMVDQPAFPRAGTLIDFDHVSASRPSQERLYGTLVILNFLVRQLNGGTEWHLRVKELLESFPDSPLLSLTSAGFPAGWEQEAIWN
ncbi:Abi family protein [Hyphomonas sp.]|uniref:Abi family protein n=1 Tax=Hyphomonas sp. TaxID=87 RepID=UPI000C5059E2|nr:Abi family protein [Hyphomonas sp.]MAB09283.1 abortive phage resistance protein [Hyphomonas sp.]MAU66713.1 abortive phage resistance protein [Hyphomonas sp.]MBM57673.1 abortive phage resistance protein [Hyphomonas sp.]